MTKVRLNQLDAAATAALWSCASPRAPSAAADSRSTPGGRAIVPSSKQQPDGTLAKALARAWRCQRMLEEDVYASVSDIGDAENISKSYVSRILRLALLVPEFVETILAGAPIKC